MRIVIFIALLMSGAFTKAETLNVEYKSFYSHLNKLDAEEMGALQFAFGFVNIHSGKLCTINNAIIITQKQNIDLEVTKENRFTVPKERALKLADAVISIELVEPNNQCDMSVQLETKPEYLKPDYSQDELKTLYTQYTNFFDEMGGWFSFMMPKVNGLNIIFENKNLEKRIGNDLAIVEGALALNASDIERLKNLSLPSEPLRITALTIK